MNTIKQYFNLILTVLIAGLIIACVWLYFSKDKLVESNEQLASRVTAVEELHEEYKKDLGLAKQNLEALREELTGVSRKTDELSRRVNTIPKPQSNGMNYKEIEIASNQLSTDVFGRIK